LGLVRIAFGLVMIGWSFSLLPDLLTLFGPGGMLPDTPRIRYTWGLLHIFGGSNSGVVAVWALLLLASIALTVGWHSRLAALVVFIGVVSFERRNVYVFNSGDVALRIEALYLVLAPGGAALSLDQRRRAGSFWVSQVRAPWVLRMMQVQLSLIYLSTVHDKLGGTTWNQGTAVSYALRLTNLQALPVPQWISTNAELMNLASWGTLALELSLGVLVWNRRARPWVLCAGVAMHFIFVTTLAVAFFSFAMYVLYVSFVPTEAAQRFADRVRASLPRRRSSTDPVPTDPALTDPAPTDPALTASSETVPGAPSTEVVPDSGPAVPDKTSVSSTAVPPASGREDGSADGGAEPTAGSTSVAPSVDGAGAGTPSKRKAAAVPPEERADVRGTSG
jgi:hypothetical protein